MSNSKSVQEQDAPLPRPVRRKRRAKADRGLPPDLELARLAAEYLQRQRKHWPEMVKAGLLPDTNDIAMGAMVEDFKQRHRTGQVNLEVVQAYRKICEKLGGNYDRYSCDNSSPNSIIDQMAHALDKARHEDRFVPWAYVFGDYSMSGLNSSRQGYMSYKKVLGHAQHLIETTYVDDFTRASRDEVEWWKLAHLSRKLKKRMIGASDGFDLSAPNWDMMISIYGLLSRLFIKGLREKVKRGMRGAARRGTCLGKQSLGFTRCVCKDEHGNVVRDAHGIPTYRPCIDPVTAPFRKLLYELFVVKCWSPYKIAKHYNDLQVDGWNGWTERAIKKLLWSAASIGVFLWNRTRREYDPDAEKWLVLDNPRSEWEVYHDRDLALVPMELWKEARRCLMAMRRKSPLTGRKQSRNQTSASTLFSGTLVCGYCEGDRELTLTRSTGKYKVMGCLNGPTGKHGCKLTTSKSTRIIEKCLLDFLSDSLFTEDVMTTLVEKANAFLTEEAHKPRVNTAPLRAEIQRREAAVKKLFLRIEKEDDPDLTEPYNKRIKEHQQEINRLRRLLHDADAENDAEPPQPLDKARVKDYVSDLRELLNQEIPAAAEAIRAVTGPIKIRQEKIPGRNCGARWIATFSPNLLSLLRRVGTKDYPDSITLEYLCARNWIIPQSVEIAIESIPRYERLAARFKKLADKGASVQTLARAHDMTWKDAKEALDFARTGKRPVYRPRPRKAGNRKKTPITFRDIVDDVVRMRDVEKRPFKGIAAMLSEEQGYPISRQMVEHAYDFAHPHVVQNAVKHGETLYRGRFSHLEPKVFQKIHEGLALGHSPSDIAKAAECSLNTVYRERTRVENGR